MRRRTASKGRPGVAVAAAVVALATGTVACSDDADTVPATTGASSPRTEVPASATTLDGTTSAAGTTDRQRDGAGEIEVAPGTEQVTVSGAPPGEELTAVGENGQPLATGVVDDNGHVVLRDLPGGATVVVEGTRIASGPVTTLRRDEHPDASFYAGQDVPAGGYGYLTTRDGTTLSVNVVLPGPADDGPYPTVVEYSGYAPSNPRSPGLGQVFEALGYAYVGVNMRGTGCSGGSFRYFEVSQLLDGYDVVETIAAQPWAEHGRVGMVGVSYPGISQLFVASTRPPSLAAITPFSVIDDSFDATLYPGGILNTGFAVPWAEERMEQAEPEGQEWVADRVDAGDDVCEANQELRAQNADLLAEIEANPYWSSPLGESLAPRTFVDEIAVPVLVAGAWQDEQTGGRFPTMLDDLTGTPHVYASLVNGWHTEAVSPAIFARMIEFLDLYVARRAPDVDRAAAVVAPLARGLYGTTDVALPADRFEGMTYEEALAAFESDPPIEVLFEQGAADGRQERSPMPRWIESFDAWPVPEAVATSWYLAPDGTLARDGPPSTAAETTYLALPDATPATFYEGSASGVWKVDADLDWVQPPPGTAASFVSEPLSEDTVVVGSGSVDLWIASNLGDTDLEVTVSELRPDGDEVYVQSGWLRASHRALDDAASTVLRPVHTHLEEDAAALPAGELTPVRVELFPFAHAFRSGSRLRLTVDAPGGNRAVWAFDTIAGGEEVTVGYGPDEPSRIVLAVVPGVDVPDAAPACGALRGQPCRRYAGVAGGGG